MGFECPLRGRCVGAAWALRGRCVGAVDISAAWARCPPACAHAAAGSAALERRRAPERRAERDRRRRAVIPRDAKALLRVVVFDAVEGRLLVGRGRAHLNRGRPRPLGRAELVHDRGGAPWERLPGWPLRPRQIPRATLGHRFVIEIERHAAGEVREGLLRGGGDE